MKDLTISFVREKETKNTVRFQEKPSAGKPPIIGTLYIQKWAVGSADNIKLTIGLPDTAADFT